MLNNAFAIGLVGGLHTVTRRGSASYNATGDYVEGATTTLDVVGSIQPLSGREIEKLPEGFRAKASAVLFTADVLQSAASGNAGDRLPFGGDTFEVLGTINWGSPVGGHYAYALERVIP